MTSLQGGLYDISTRGSGDGIASDALCVCPTKLVGEGFLQDKDRVEQTNFHKHQAFTVV